MIDPKFKMEQEDTQDGSPQTTLSFAVDEILEDENKTQKYDGHTPASNVDYETMCACVMCVSGMCVSGKWDKSTGVCNLYDVCKWDA